jgi:Zn-dependent protease
MSNTRSAVGVLGSAWSLGSIRGIQIGVDRSWIVIFLLITYSLAVRFGAEHEHWAGAERWAAAVFASLLFFTSIVLHELGHSLTALRFGVGVESITLFLFGGVARLRSDPRRPRDEILIALAGPLVSVVLGVGFMGAAALLPSELLSATFGWLGLINLILAAFNVLPGFPLDGGRVLRGVVWAATGSFERATRAASASGAAMAYGLMALGALAAFAGQLLGGLWMVFIGWFLLSCARSTVAQVELEALLSPIRASEVMEPVVERCVDGAESLADLAAGPVLRRGLRTLYVTGPAGELRGLITLADIARTPIEDRATTSGASIMRPPDGIATLSPDTTAWSALMQMAERGVNQLPVVTDGRLLGAVTRERLLGLVQSGRALGQSDSIVARS